MIRAMVRVAAEFLALCATVIALAGAGGTTQVTRSEAVAFARAVNLRTSDLPGSTPLRGEFGPPLPAAVVQRRDLQCGRRSRTPSPAVASEGSGFFDPHMGLVGSIIFVMPSEALAEAEVVALPSRSGRACLAHFVRREFAGVEGALEGATYATKVTFVPVAKLLGRGAIAVHVLAKLLPRKAKFAYVAEVIFRVGAADILFAARSEGRRFPVATERRLLSLLYRRAKAHKL
jgi:hypothetical protein